MSHVWYQLLVVLFMLTHVEANAERPALPFHFIAIHFERWTFWLYHLVRLEISLDLVVYHF